MYREQARMMSLHLGEPPMRILTPILMILVCCTSSMADTITSTINGLEIGIDESTGSMVRVAYAPIGVILECPADAAGVLDVAHPLKEFVPLRLGSPYSQALVTR